MTNDPDRVVDILGMVRGETEKAFRFQPAEQTPGHAHGQFTCWLPKSLCEWYPKDGIMVIPEWLAQEKDLI